MNIVLEATYTPGFTTLAASGAAADADSLPTCAVYEDTTSTAIVTPTVVKLATGVYVVAIPCTAVNGFEAGKTYNVVISATIGGVAAKAKVAQFVCVVNGLDAIAAAVATRLSAAGYTVPPSVGAILAEIDTNSTALAALAAGQVTINNNVLGIGSTVSTNLDAKVSTRSTYAGGPVASVTAPVTVGTNNDKAGYALGATGLDQIPITAPTGVASNFREMVVQTWRRWFKLSTLDGSNLKTYADNGTTVLTTQPVSDNGTTQTQGAAT